jgi:hypothetical protein
MNYKVFAKDSVMKLADINDVHWPLVRTGDILPLRVEGKDGLYTVVKIGSFSIEQTKLIAEIYVEDFFAAQKAKQKP